MNASPQIVTKVYNLLLYLIPQANIPFPLMGEGQGGGGL